MTKTQLEEQLEISSMVYQRLIEGYAKEVRSENVIPFCDKHSFDFFAGGGIWFLADRITGKTIGTSVDLKYLVGASSFEDSKLRTDFEAIEDILRVTEPFTMSEIGAWIDSYSGGEA